ncbi:hypothetical protein QJS10_CPA09g00743 [Acorus calamus]|uniref:Uncharacterized protein n=1 Tax=Acorus calamus TaxID=4465 RepID=A0AAV9E2I5_ACOCL|nr:hypothetical protein QJS10_CPA09g00743 [Acorus calamus]
MGLISKELYKSAKKSCAGQYAKPNNSQCVRDVGAINKVFCFFFFFVVLIDSAKGEFDLECP